ncbi:MAG: bifunctional [glutamine synthetase] adenylyltransferase/[glutamine synthetase]-adenylyl-L-tyrosine phosphorylase [Pseudomonadota bacterium]
MEFSDRITRLPRPYDMDRAADIAAAAPWADGELAALLSGAAGCSPYLARLVQVEADWLREAVDGDPIAAVDAELARLDIPETVADVASALHRAKRRIALLAGLADLGGVWGLHEVTGALTHLADRAVDLAIQAHLRPVLSRGKLPGMGPDDLVGRAGLCVLAMGKMGAFELNYSSDIDLICLFDDQRFDNGDLPEARSQFVRVIRKAMALLSDITADGYVFRTDLRLRPDPSVTPVVVSMASAERYYEGLGRTWERAAFIKARPCAGDLAAGTRFLDEIRPFIWRRHLDYATVEDAHEIRKKIRIQKGVPGEDALDGRNLKLGKGGIREIEFFAQTRQLTQGGRNPRLRNPSTLGALKALETEGIIDQVTADQLSSDYIAHRTLEHRLQMIEDARTHSVPLSIEARQRVAALMGVSDVAAWEREIAQRMERVHALAQDFFELNKSEPEGWFEEANESEFERLGFQRPADMHRLFERWRTGQIAATRDARAQGMYQRLELRIQALLSEAGQPDQAAFELDRFLSGLPSGVQVFSLFTANPHLLDLIVRICARAPRLADHLGQNPQVLDTLLDQTFFEPVAETAVLRTELEAELAEETDYERKLDLTRRWARELQFRAGVQLLFEMSGAEESAAAFSAIAEACVQALLPHVAAEFGEKHGPPPGRGLAVIAMGKLGSGEMTARSDLDLITVYDSAGAEASEGRKPLAPIAYFPRLTQALVAALTAPTAEGRLYEVDMRLRPSGRMGPVAVSLEGFQRYQQNEAWVWEHLALTRARVIAGDDTLVADIEAIIQAVLATRKAQPKVLQEANEMRARISDARTSEEGEVWSFKGAPGGLLEIEFLAQTGVLYQGIDDMRQARLSYDRLADSGWMTQEAVAELKATHLLLQQMQQIERVALDRPLDPDEIGAGLLDRLLSLAGVDDAAGLKEKLATAQSRASAIIAARFEAF